MTLTEKVAYLKGLVEGIGVDETTNNGKIMKAVLDVLDDMAFTVSDLEDSTSELYEEVEAIDEDLSSLEDEIYGEEDDDDCCCDDNNGGLSIIWILVILYLLFCAGGNGRGGPEGRRARPRGIRAPAGVRRSARGHGGWCDPHP